MQSQEDTGAVEEVRGTFCIDFILRSFFPLILHVGSFTGRTVVSLQVNVLYKVREDPSRLSV